MTPERKAYLAKCSKRKKYLRVFIKESKIEIRKLKSDLMGAHIYSRNVDLLLIRHNKIKLNAYRHELARLKGMDRVVEPSNAYIDAYGYKGGLCQCGKHIIDAYDYCPWCGRRLLWEKVKQ